jgi:Ion channel
MIADPAGGEGCTKVQWSGCRREQTHSNSRCRLPSRLSSLTDQRVQMVHSLSPASVLVSLLHLWRVVLLVATITHQRHHPALAILMLVPLNHIFFKLTASLDRPAASGGRPGLIRALVVIGLYLLASSALVWWHGSLDPLRAEVRALSRTWEWWVLVGGVTGLTLLYRPLVTALTHLVGATGLGDSRLWSALGLAIAVWVWCDGLFAAVYQQLSLACEDPARRICQGEQPFSQSLSRFADAAYFSTVTLSSTGYGEIVPVSGLARAVVAVEIMIGFGLLGFLLSRVAGLTLPATKP